MEFQSLKTMSCAILVTMQNNTSPCTQVRTRPDLLHPLTKGGKWAQNAKSTEKPTKVQAGDPVIIAERKKGKVDPRNCCFEIKTFELHSQSKESKTQKAYQSLKEINEWWKMIVMTCHNQFTQICHRPSVAPDDSSLKQSDKRNLETEEPIHWHDRDHMIDVQDQGDTHCGRIGIFLDNKE